MLRANSQVIEALIRFDKKNRINKHCFILFNTFEVNQWHRNLKSIIRPTYCEVNFQ